MTNPNIWAALLLLALTGWATTLIFLSKSMLPMANALNVLLKANSHIDDRIREVVERIRVRERRSPITRVNVPREEAQQPADALRDIFGGDPIEPAGEQPPADLEVVEL